MSNQNPFLEIDQSRRLHEMLVQCDADLRALEDSITSAQPYSIPDYNRRFQAIMKLREQTRQEIDKMIEHDRAMAEAWHERL